MGETPSQQSIVIKYSSEKMNVCLSSGNTITECSLRSAFLLHNDEIVRLIFKEKGGKESSCVSKTIPEPCFVLPDAFENKEFILHSRPPSRPTYSMEKQDFSVEERQILKQICANEQRRPSSAQASGANSPIMFENVEEQEADAYVKSFGGYVRYVKMWDEQEIKGAVTIISDTYCITNAHIAFPKIHKEYRRKRTMYNAEKIAKNTVGQGQDSKRPNVDLVTMEQNLFKWIAKKESRLVGKAIEVYKFGTDSVVEAKIKKIDLFIDFAVLFSPKGGLLDEGLKPLEYGGIYNGANYITLGLPKSNNAQIISVLKGHLSNVSRTSHSKGYLYGAYGADKGYSGGPVLSIGCKNELIGIVVGGKLMDLSQTVSHEELVNAFNNMGSQAPLFHIIPFTLFQNSIETAEVPEDELPPGSSK